MYYLSIFTVFVFNLHFCSALASPNPSPNPTSGPGIIESGISHLSTYLYGFTSDPLYVSISSYLAPATSTSPLSSSKPNGWTSSSSKSQGYGIYLTNEWATAIAGDAVSYLLGGGTVTTTSTSTVTSGAKTTGTKTVSGTGSVSTIPGKNRAVETGVPRAVMGIFGALGAFIGML